MTQTLYSEPLASVEVSDPASDNIHGASQFTLHHLHVVTTPKCLVLFFFAEKIQRAGAEESPADRAVQRVAEESESNLSDADGRVIA